MISTKGRYALRLMINLALYSDGNYVRLKDISEKEEISIKYLEQVVALLYKSNLDLQERIVKYIFQEERSKRQNQKK